MDEFEQSDLERETNDSHIICYQNAVHYRRNAFMKKKCGILSLVFGINTREMDD